MDDAPKPRNRDIPDRNDAAGEEEADISEAEFIDNLEIDDEFLALLDEGIWSAENEPLVTPEELKRETDELFARWREEDEAAKKNR